MGYDFQTSYPNLQHDESFYRHSKESLKVRLKYASIRIGQHPRSLAPGEVVVEMSGTYTETPPFTL